MALRAGTNRDWKRESILHLLLAGACALRGRLCRRICNSLPLTAPAAFSSYSSGSPTVNDFSLIYELYVMFSNFVDRFHSYLEIPVMPLGRRSMISFFGPFGLRIRFRRCKKKAKRQGVLARGRTGISAAALPAIAAIGVGNRR